MICKSLSCVFLFALLIPLFCFALPLEVFESSVFVSKYLETPAYAKKISRVPLFTSPFAFSGYFTTNVTTNTNMFYIFVEAEDGNKNAPVLLWLQGGPGASSLHALFTGVGPFRLSDEPPPTHLVSRPGSWNERYAILYIDNPVGTGFSFTPFDSAYSHTEAEVSENLYRVLQQFYTLFSEYQTNDFYLCGESYAGKYIPPLALRIDKENRAGSKPHIPLRGIAIGNGFSDPETQIGMYHEFMRAEGLIGIFEAEALQAVQDKCIAAIRAARWLDAVHCMEELINGPPDLIQTFTGTDNYYDIRLTTLPDFGPDFKMFVNRSDIRAALHVGEHYFQNDDRPYTALVLDTPQSVKSCFPVLLNKGYKVLLYSGQFDLIVAPPTTEAMIRTFDWSGTHSFFKQPQTVWKVSPKDVEIAGYVRQYQNFSYVVVRGAGHLVPFDQLRSSRDMLDRWIRNIPWK